MNENRDVKCVLIHDNFQNFKSYNIPKAQLVIAAGCTGGMHRAVFIANHLYQLLKEKGCIVKLEHRDLMKNEVWEHVREEV